MDKIAKKAFKIPRSQLVATYSILIAVLLSGTALSIWYKDWLWLARFGAFLVCLAMLFELTGLPENIINKAMAIAESINLETVSSQVRKKPYKYGIHPNLNEDQIDEVTVKELRRRVKEVKELAKKTTSEKIKKHQFFIASIGTLLWAFADLLKHLLPLE